MVAFRDEQTGQTFAFTDDSGGLLGDGEGFLGTDYELSDLFGAAGEGVATGGLLDVDYGQGEYGRSAGEAVGDWLEDLTGMGGGGSQPSGQNGGGLGLPQLPGGSQNGGQVGLPQLPGSGGGGMGGQLAGGGAGSVDYGGVIGQVGAQLVSYLSSNPQLLKYVASKLGLTTRKGAPTDPSRQHPKCVNMLVDHLSAPRREALEQFLCGMKAPMGTADEQTFLICELVNMPNTRTVIGACESCE